jgi:hypothetical protein
LKTDGAGNLTWTNGDNSTVLGKDSIGKVEFATLNSVLQAGPVDLGSQPLTTTGAITASSLTSTGAIAGSTAVFSANSSSDVVRITQTGTGNALKVEDSTNPDSSPFVIDSNGNVGIGIATPASKLHVDGTIIASTITAPIIDVSSTTGSAFIEVGGVGNAYIDLKVPNPEDNDIRIGTTGSGGYISTSNNGNIELNPNGTGCVKITNIQTYANNAAAVTGGLAVNSVYKTVTGELRIVV